MNDRLSRQQGEAILKAINDTIENGSWDQSEFLKVICKNLKEIRDGFLKELDAEHFDQKYQAQIAKVSASRTNQQEVHVALYCAQGTSLQAWEKIVNNLPKQMISRAIYAQEDDVQEIIKSKEKKQNEAYVSIYINKSDILPIPSDRAALDKLGKPLLSLKDQTLKLENITRFVHITGTYRLSNFHLVKTTDTSQ